MGAAGTVVVVLGVTLAAGATLWAVLRARRPRGLVLPPGTPYPDRATVATARRLLRWTRPTSRSPDTGAEPVAFVEHVGRGAVRLIVVGPRGTGDLVVSDEALARAAAALAGVPVSSATDREVAARFRLGPADWAQMARPAPGPHRG